MKGVLLAGGTGSRLMPSTHVTNKHLLPVYDRPMIYHPLETLADAGIEDVLVVTGEHHAGAFVELLGDGTNIPAADGFTFEGDITYRVQTEPLGIAHAIGLAEGFIGPDERFVVILGDNIFGGSVAQEVRRMVSGEHACHIVLSEVDDPERFANPRMVDGSIAEMVEKPDSPHTPFAVTGLYGLYNDGESSLFRRIDGLEPSERGEYEITDILNWYLDRGELSYSVYDGFWTDAGNPDSLLAASTYMNEQRRE